MKPHRRSVAAPAAVLAFALLASGAAGQDIPEMSPDAATAFAEGMALYTAADYGEAAAAFADAYRADTSFAVAAFFEGLNWANVGEADSARAAYARAAEGRNRMSDYYRHRLAAQMAHLQGDRRGYLEENRLAARIAPGTKADYNVAQGAIGLGRAREALRLLNRLDPHRPPMKGWFGYWTIRHNAQHLVGEFEAELASAREARGLFPDRAAFYYDEAEALLALGRAAEVPEVADAFEHLDAPYLPFLVTIAAESDVHGHPDLARRLLDRAMQAYAALPPDQAAENSTRNWIGLAHQARDEFAEAAKIFAQLSRDDPDNDWYRASAAVMAAEQGDGQAAEAEIRRLLAKETPDDAGQLSMYAANIAAALGDGDRFTELAGRARAAGAPHSGWDHRYYGYRKIRSHAGYKDFIRPSG